MLKNLAILLMLLSAPFAQARAVMACAVMPVLAHAAEPCCCEDEVTGPSLAQNAGLDGMPCCEVMIDAGGDPGMVAISDATEKKPVKKLWDHSPDLATAPPQFALAAFELQTSPSRDHAAHPAWDDASRTYLRTSRLRL